MLKLLLICLFLSLSCTRIAIFANCEYVRELSVSENVPIGSQIGFISKSSSSSNVDDAMLAPPFLIVPVPGSEGYVDADLAIDHKTGEIRTKRALDRETRASYVFVAIPLNGEHIRVIIKVLDENDNAPTFPVPVMNIEFPENTPKDVKRTLNPARDLDLGAFNTQKYNIISGNLNNAFKLAYHRERDSVLYLDLQINGLLDREITSSYTLVVEALDGGSPPLRGQMIVNITILDVNDNQPIFNQSRYFATVLENATVHSSVLQVYATDIDDGDNGKVEYYINRRQSDRDSMFRIDSKTGLILVNKPLDFETKELHELVIVAKDNGDLPLETTAFVTIRVLNINDNQPVIDVIFLSDDATPKISEDAQPGEFVARISVNDPDSKTKYSNVNVSLSGGEGHFGLTTRDNIIYLMIVSLPLDRELKANYTLNVVATDTGAPPLHASKTIYLRITDINDNPPLFEKQIYHANIMEVADPGTSVIQVTAIDKDEGNNSVISYSLRDTPETHSQWFQIDKFSGLITTQTHIDCETEPVPKLTILATDNGVPPLSSTATVLVTIHDINDNEPLFDQSFYNVSVAENEMKGSCILTVSATDSDCGVNAMVNYTIGDRFKKLNQFVIKADTGEICIENELDYETRSSYEFPVIATDRGGLSTTAVVKILLTDVNDNVPVFYPREYNVSLRETDAYEATSTPIVQVVAKDIDFGKFGHVTYRIVSGNEAGIFRLDPQSGQLFVTKPNVLANNGMTFYHLNVTAIDGGDLQSKTNAEIYISLIDSAQRPPIFDKTQYSYQVKENAKYNTMVGSITATNFGSKNDIRYSIYSGDPDSYFSIDPLSGFIRVANPLDHETKPQVLLNIQATSGDPPAYGHTQVNIDIEDVNDNPPEFESNSIRISIPENTDLGVPIYAAHARDKDSGKSGVVSYYLVNFENSTKMAQKQPSALFSIDPKTGSLTLLRHLDYETSQKHALIVKAVDLGDPPLSTNLTVYVDVQDVNDNKPIFTRSQYHVNVSEETSINSRILQVEAIDYDTGNNARITYRIDNIRTKEQTSMIPDEANLLFGIFPNNGWLYLRGTLDREFCDFFNITVLASDNGTPIFTTKANIILNVQDANDNSPEFLNESYEFEIQENMPKGTRVGFVRASDKDIGQNAAIRYSLIPSNSSFQIDHATGEITIRESLDRELRATYEITAEARDYGIPQRSARVPVRIIVQDVNDNSPDIVDPQDDVIVVREGQAIGTEVVKVRAVDRDNGENATIKYSIIRGRDSDGINTFSIDTITGLIKTKKVLDHEEKHIYRLAVAATDNGNPSKQKVRVLRIEVLDLHDNRPTFTSSSVVFRVREDVAVGHVVGTLMNNPSFNDVDTEDLDVTYTLTPLTNDTIKDAFEIDYHSGSLVVAKALDRELQHEFKLEVRSLDITTSNNPQSSAITVKIEVADVNDNAPVWNLDPIEIKIAENTKIGTSLYNFSASDADSGRNGEVHYELLRVLPSIDDEIFTIDPLTGVMHLTKPLDYEICTEYLITVQAIDQSSNISERLRSSVTVQLFVQDINDNAPVFVHPSGSNVTVHLSDEVQIGHVVTHILASDADSEDNGKVTYALVAGNEEEYFKLDAKSGVLTLVKPLRSIKKFEYDSTLTNIHTRIAKHNNNFEISNFNLQVVAKDNGRPTKSAKMDLRIVVFGSQNMPPRFLDPIYYANISESAGIGSFVVRVNAKSYIGGDAENITYSIPKGVVDDAFVIDPVRGIITTAKLLDRESRDLYLIPVYAQEFRSFESSQMNYGISTVVVRVMDVNDHKPIFGQESCNTLLVPENHETGIIHTVLAFDLDSGVNSEITYSITGGNVGNKFNINSYTGELTVKPLDREQQSKYVLQITAQDRGTPVMYQNTCNLTIIVEDLNDNTPRFEKPSYSVTVSEGVGIGHVVLVVKAQDADSGNNGRVYYSVQNETDSMFQIDSKTGVITTTGFLDREVKQFYELIVVATDGGKSTARSERVSVQITLDDVNDNAPMFKDYPFRSRISHLVQPGQVLLNVEARDGDAGINGDIIYELISTKSSNKFKIDLNTGVLTATQSLVSENGKTVYLEVMAKDKGSPGKTSFGLIELNIGDDFDRHPRLKFQNDTYFMNFNGKVAEGVRLGSVHAITTNGRRLSSTYSIIKGNEDDIFAIDSNNGEIILAKDLKITDREWQPKYYLGVMSKAKENPLMYAYCDVEVTFAQMNVRPPMLTQKEYLAFISEGRLKGTFVAKVSAASENEHRQLLYHIVDGNHDNAFVIEPAYSGVVRTNIVLDREIREQYTLKIIATDVNYPQLTTTGSLLVRVLDVNDNQPTFPPNNFVTIPEDTTVGSSVAQITANDVDTSPILTYSFKESSLSTEMSSIFGINRFNGKIILKKKLDYEKHRDYKLQIVVSDKNYSAETGVSIQVTDANDNAPSFEKTIYQSTVSTHSISPTILTETVRVSATDADSGKNAEISYKLVRSQSGFTVDSSTGRLLANLTQIMASNPTKMYRDFDLLVSATDRGVPSLRSIVPVRVHILNDHQQRNAFFQSQYRAKVAEDAPIGTKILNLVNNVEDKRSLAQGINLEIVSGNENLVFDVLMPDLVIILVKPLDRETRETYQLELLMTEKELTASNVNENSTISVTINVDDVNDNVPKFISTVDRAVINESVALRHVIARVEAIDDDASNSENSEVVYSIISGNDEQLFTIDLISGQISVNNRLDFDKHPEPYSLVIQACDSGLMPKCAVKPFIVELLDSNDNSPKFPLLEYFTMIGENEPIGTTIASIKAIDADAGKFGELTYALSPLNDFSDIDESWKGFSVDSASGTIFSQQIFDYETKSRYSFLLAATDSGGKSTTTKIHVLIESRDEFVPQFTEKSYHFVLRPSPKGKYFAPADHIVGYIKATDKDLGMDGRIIYQLTTQNPYFKVNFTTGAIMTKQKIDHIGPKDVSLVATASSGRQGSLSNMTVVEILIDSNAIGTAGDMIREDTAESGSWVIGLLITLLLFLTVFATAFFFLHWRKRGLKHVSKPRLNSENNTVNTNSYVDPSTFDTIPIRGSDATQSTNSGFAPPRYDEIPPYGLHTGSSNSGAATTSDLSTSQSGSSGRGSAEDDGEDEEIRMINEGPLQREALHTGSRLSDVSVHNSHNSQQEYFARLGASHRSTSSSTRHTGGPLQISDHHHPMPIEEMQMYEDDNDEVDITNLIYAKLNDLPIHPNHDLTSSHHHQDQEDMTSNYNWDYLLDWGPQYQPLAHVFSEIARLKDDSVSMRSGQSVASSIRSKNSLHHTMKHLPPPLITNVAPRLVPVLSSRSRGSSKHHYPPVTNRPIFNHHGNGAGSGGFSTPSPMPPSFTNNLIPSLSTHTLDSSGNDVASVHSLRKS
ncbi:protein dachsous [Culicoides brevitarsis]|uniref:protein dachsous n=1 Tax=Culicoides brevitarsis TaxID=469753 RepID=UPI00307C3BD1